MPTEVAIGLDYAAGKTKPARGGLGGDGLSSVQLLTRAWAFTWRRHRHSADIPRQTNDEEYAKNKEGEKQKLLHI